MNPEKTDLAIYLPSLRGGGAERVMVTLANGFAARGHQVDLVLAKAEGAYLNAVDSQVRIVDLHARRVLTSLPGLVRYLRRHRPVAMLSAMKHANVIAVTAHMLARTPTRIVLSEHANFTRSQMNATTFRERLIVRFMRWAYPRADRIVAVSFGVANDLAPHIGMPRSEIDVVYNPVVTDDLLRRANESVNHPWFEPGEPPVILGVGRLEPQKSFSALINAFAKLRQSRNARLIILGEGSLRPVLEAQIKRLDLSDNIQLPGFASNPYSLMRASSLFVLSSLFEGLPTVLIEAMACGTQVISTNCPSGPEEILKNGQWGQLVPVGDDVALATAMAAALDCKNPLNVASRAAEFGAERSFDEYLKLMLPGQTKEQP